MGFFDALSGSESKKKGSMTPSDRSTLPSKQDEILQRIAKEHKSRTGVGRFFKHPVRVLTEKPGNILIVCAPAALIVFFWGFYSGIHSMGMRALTNSTVIDDYIVVSVLILIIPMAILDFWENRRILSIENALPNFFRDLAGMNDSGMTLPNAVHLVSNSEYGSLTPHVKSLDNMMSWGVGFVEGMYIFGKKLGTPLADRSVDLIAKASKAGGDISKVLHAAAQDTFQVVNLASERRNNMMIYVIIVLVSSAVFLFIIAVLVSSFFSTMATAGAAAQSAGAGKSFMGGFDLPAYKRLFSHAAMIQAFFSGIVAGQMGEGRLLAGLKYSAIMLYLSWVMFRVFI